MALSYKKNKYEIVYFFSSKLVRWNLLWYNLSNGLYIIKLNAAHINCDLNGS